MQLESTLDQFPLSELLSMMVSSSVKGVLEIGAQASVALDDDAVTCPRQLLHYLRYERDASLAARCLAWNSDQHALRLLAVMCEAIR